MSKRQIVNIVNFIRAVEPRMPVDLVLPVKEQIRLMKEHNLRGTFLLQYDSLLVPEYIDLLKFLDPAQFELGVWFETVQPQVEEAGLTWTGRFPWDWHAHCGFSVGYTKEEREKLADVLYEKFREIFGYYPRVFGSWFFDSHTIRYISDKYGLDAICNCKEQYGTDGYTLWGGYYGQAYYPSRTNIFMPAQTEDQQIPAPLFRMLGSDQVYQYDFGMSPENGAQAVQGVITLEPVYNGGGGGVPEWVDWFLRENYNGECLTFGYAQAGQENSFGWPAMKDGLTYQFAQFAKLRDEGKIEVEPLGDTGRWFRKTYQSTPASAITAHTAYDDPGKNSVWYSSKYYRINLYGDRGRIRIRDLHIFRETYPDPYENDVCPGNEAVYETLPVIDGNRHSGNGVTAGGYFTYWDGTEPAFDEMTFEDLGGGCAKVTYGKVVFELSEAGVKITADKPFRLRIRIGRDGNHLPSVVHADGSGLDLDYNGTGYSLRLAKGRMIGMTAIDSSAGTVELRMDS
ncbi:MAG: hypothetical protein IJF78_10915 [Clostridia bacterium]|nr:hypothetical protein [Clostridia bacterium]